MADPRAPSAAFTAEERLRLRFELLELAGCDDRISGTAITGSAAGGGEDRWSDIDIAFGLREAAELPNVLADWTARTYRQCDAVHHVDVRAGASIYRVFLLAVAELARAFGVGLDLLIREIETVDDELAARLEPVLLCLKESAKR